MKKTLPIAIIATSLLGLGSLSSCHDEDFDVSTAVLQERAFEQNFIKEFGKPSANQSWDFYSQKMEAIRQGAAVTRATMAEGDLSEDINQPTNQYFKGLIDSWHTSLEEGLDNSRVGQNNYSLTSTGDFKIYAVRYAGGLEVGPEKVDLNGNTQSPWDDYNIPDYDFDFGIIYNNGQTVPDTLSLFGKGFKNGFSPTDPIPTFPNSKAFGNPGWGKEVRLPKGTSFIFYLSYSYTWTSGDNSHTIRQTLYSDRTPEFTYAYRRNNAWRESTLDFPNYGGASTLLYSTEYIDPETGKDEQVMMIGFEDAFGLDGTHAPDDWDDMDFNDVVLIIEGELPEPTAKRFFVEDKSNFDWDYNDVVFDVMNTGIVLRALGGTLPVFLRVQDRLPGSTPQLVRKGGIAELHELMQNLQPQTIHQNEELTYQREVMENGKKVMKTFYKPIDAASYETTGIEGLWFDAVQVVTWTSLGTSTNNTRLEEGEVERFANPLVTNKVGDVELVVLPEWQENYNLGEIASLSEFDFTGDDSNDARQKIIKMTDIGGIPAIWSGPVSINWVKEMQKITLGYPRFYGGGTTPEGSTQPEWWADDETKPNNSSYWYTFGGDKPEE